MGQPVGLSVVSMNVQVTISRVRGLMLRTLVELTQVLHVPSSAWADEKLVEVAYQVGNMVGQQNRQFDQKKVMQSNASQIRFPRRQKHLLHFTSKLFQLSG